MLANEMLKNEISENKLLNNEGFFDTHTHITKCQHLTAAEYLKKAAEAGVTAIFDAGVWPDDFNDRFKEITAAAAEVAGPQIYFGIAAAPHNSPGWDKSIIDEIDAIITEYGGHIKAIGEIGLEYHNLTNKTEQKELFRTQLELAAKWQKPVTLHIREAFADAYELARTARRNDGKPEGIVHCFTGDKTAARRFLDLGYMLSFSGILTYNNSGSVQEALKYAPLERLLVETDSPWLTPQPVRKEKNDSSFIVHTINKIVELKKEDEKTVTAQLFKNSKEVYQIS